MIKALLTAPFSEEGLEKFKAVSGYEFILSTKPTKEELAEAAIGDLSALRAESLGSAKLYTDKSEDGQAGCAAVWSEGKTAYLLAAPCSAETMELAIESMK